MSLEYVSLVILHIAREGYIIKGEKIIIGVDASNLRRGGGITHISELLNVLEADSYNIQRVVIWGCQVLLSELPDKSWIKKVAFSSLCKGLFRRSIWQKYELDRAARRSGCDILFIPGGNYSGSFSPVVCMNQNLLPFDQKEYRRYAFSLMRIKWMLLKHFQVNTIRKSAGVIYLSKYAQKMVQNQVGEISGREIVIPHGVNPRFISDYNPHNIVEKKYTIDRPFRLLYVSIVDQYKHQWHVVRGVSMLREHTGLPVVLDLVGPSYAPAMKRLDAAIDSHDPDRSWVNYRGAVPYEELHQTYQQADMGIWASTCETFGLILLEYMAAGLPIACSNIGPSSEILNESAFYFDPENPEEIAHTLQRALSNRSLRNKYVKENKMKLERYSWEMCASKTFNFLSEVAWNSMVSKKDKFYTNRTLN